MPATNKSDTLDISKDDEKFLKNILKELYRKIVKTKKSNGFNDFEKILSEWIKHKCKKSDKNPKEILELMKNYKDSAFWITSFMGFLYQLGIGCDVDRTKAHELYLLAIENEIG